MDASPPSTMGELDPPSSSSSSSPVLANASDGSEAGDGGTDIGGVDVSVDDRRALWALTNRHLRSPAFPAVLLVRQALRRGAQRVLVRTAGHQLVVADDGVDVVDELDALATVLARPLVASLHAIERAWGTELLVSTAMASRARVQSATVELVLAGGEVVGLHRRGYPIRLADGPWPNTVVLERPAALGAEERRELRAWIPAPRARVIVDGKTLPKRQGLPKGVFFPRAIHRRGGQGALGLQLGSAVSQVTVTARGTWVAQEQYRPRGLPVVAIWDHDDIPPDPTTLLPLARQVVDRATDDLITNLASGFEALPRRRRQELRRLLLRGGVIPGAFVHTPLFDDETGPFRRSWHELQGQSRLLLGRHRGDLIVDDDARAFLHAAFPGRVVDALPPPPERLLHRLRRGFRG